MKHIAAAIVFASSLTGVAFGAEGITTSATLLSDAAVNSAKTIGERGRSRDLVVGCTSDKVRETFRHDGLAKVQMRMMGAAGEIAANAEEARKQRTSFATLDSQRQWHLTVVAAPTSNGTVQNILLKSGAAVVPASLMMTAPMADGSMAGYATFTSDEARAIVESGDFQVVAVLQAGQRSCDVSEKDRLRLGL